MLHLDQSLQLIAFDASAAVTVRSGEGHIQQPGRNGDKTEQEAELQAVKDSKGIGETWAMIRCFLQPLLSNVTPALDRMSQCLCTGALEVCARLDGRMLAHSCTAGVEK